MSFRSHQLKRKVENCAIGKVVARRDVVDESKTVVFNVLSKKSGASEANTKDLFSAHKHT